MNDAFEYHGHWWLPGTEGVTVPGILSFDPGAEATLDLLGSLKGVEGDLDLAEPKIILGLSSNGKLITLHTCTQISSNLAFGSGFSTSTYAVNTILVGQHFSTVEDLLFERLVVEYLYAEAWACATGFKFRFVDGGAESHVQWMEVKHELLENVSSHVGEQYEVILSFPRECKLSPVPRTWVNIHQPAELTIKFSKKVSFGRLHDIAFRLQHFLSLGMRRSAYPVAVRGYTGILGEARPVEVFYRPLGRTDNPQERPELHEMLYSRLDLPDGFGPAVARWLERAEKLDPVYRLFLGTLYNPRAFIEQQFLSLVTALEVYHRRIVSTTEPSETHDKRKREVLEAVSDEHREWVQRQLTFSHEPNLEARLREIFRKHLEVVQAIVGYPRKVRSDFIKQVVDARNYRAHFSERLEGRATRGADLHPINQKVGKLLEACLMAEIGFGDDRIREAVSRPR